VCRRGCCHNRNGRGLWGDRPLILAIQLRDRQAQTEVEPTSQEHCFKNAAQLTVFHQQARDGLRLSVLLIVLIVAVQALDLASGIQPNQAAKGFGAVNKAINLRPQTGSCEVMKLRGAHFLLEPELPEVR
jgi:hypothetical protein